MSLAERQAPTVKASPELDQYEALEYQKYSQHLDYLGTNSPQSLGMDPQDFSSALKDPEVSLCGSMNERGEIVIVPQLSPTRHYSWLNEEKYSRSFPDAFSRGALKHILTLPELGFSPETRSGVRELASQSGVLVFDAPDSDPEAVQRTLQMLQEEGIVHGPVGSIARQTYYGGKVRLEKGFDPEKPIMDLHEVFSAMQAEKPIDLTEGAAYVDLITDPAQVYKLQGLYENAFAILNDHPCRQGIDPEEFRRIMAEDPEIAKLICNVNTETGVEIATVCLLGNDLEKYPWLKPKFYSKLYPEEDANGQILYFPALATDTQHRGEGRTADVVNLIAEMVEKGNNEIVVAFDCCDFNVDVLSLSEMLEDLINNTPQASIKFDVIGEHTYYAVQLYPQEDN